ncbi:hypothetical protein BDQ17DRAFT_1331442 [Cyathus striatus]|nr:hypothetical protein BDQ17DRAFT_1331442 [Cyathus striatus]
MWKDVRTIEIIPGRVLMLITQWRNNGETIKILNVYAPNQKPEQLAFWQKIKDNLDNRRIPKPDIILGNFNIVEDSADRLPAHPDDNKVVEALKDIKSRLNLVDGWCTENPDSITFTYTQEATKAQSRIDRIYISKKMEKHSRNWGITHSRIETTDHKITHTQIFDPGAPEISPGRWSIPSYALENSNLRKEIVTLTKTLGNKLAAHDNREEGQNEAELAPNSHPKQSVYQEYK